METFVKLYKYNFFSFWKMQAEVRNHPGGKTLMDFITSSFKSPQQKSTALKDERCSEQCLQHQFFTFKMSASLSTNEDDG